MVAWKQIRFWRSAFSSLGLRPARKFITVVLNSAVPVMCLARPMPSSGCQGLPDYQLAQKGIPWEPKKAHRAKVFSSEEVSIDIGSSMRLWQSFQSWV